MDLDPSSGQDDWSAYFLYVEKKDRNFREQPGRGFRLLPYFGMV